MFAVKITVVKTEYYPELVKDVNMDIEREFGPCPFFKEGQEIIVKSIDEIPEKFCSWAWGDIERDVALILFGAQPQPVLKNPNSMYSCCDEGLRPVIFKLERIVLVDDNTECGVH